VSSAKAIHPGVDPSCALCNGSGYQVARSGEFARAGLCACVKACPHCRDTGFVAVDAGPRARRARCGCQEFHGRISNFNDVGIPARHAASTREGFDTAGARMQGFMAVSQYIQRWDHDGDNRGLVLYGAVGRGKTHLLVALLRELVFGYGLTARFVEFSHLLADLKSGFDVGRGSASTLDPLVAVDVLAIDELGKGRNTEFEGTVVDELVSRRYNAAKPILATTNYAPGTSNGRATPNMANGEMPALIDRVGDRVYSRLRETADFVPLRGEDYREHIRRL